MAATPTVTFRLPPELRQYFETMAQQEARSLGAVLTLVLQEWKLLNESGALHEAREAYEELPEGHALVGYSRPVTMPIKRKRAR